MRIEFLIVLTLAVGATFFVVVVATGLLINKWVEVRRSKGKARLYDQYSGMFAEVLLQPLPGLPAGTKTSGVFRQYDGLIEPILSGLKWSTPARKQLHREAIRNVLMDFAKDLTGETLERLVFFSYAFGFVEDEIELLANRHWWVRAQAARDLGLLRTRRAIPALTAALEDEHLDVRTQAMQSLVVLVGVEALQPIFRATRDMSRWTALELSVIVQQFEDKSLPYLVEALRETDQSVVLFSIEMMGEIGFTSAVEPLLDLAASYPNTVIRAKAIEALGKLGNENAEPLLREAVKNPYPAIRRSALQALERIGSRGSIPTLVDCLHGGERGEQVSAARALAKSGQEGLDMLVSLKNDRDEMIRGIVNQVLEETQGQPGS